MPTQVYLSSHSVRKKLKSLPKELGLNESSKFILLMRYSKQIHPYFAPNLGEPLVLKIISEGVTG